MQARTANEVLKAQERRLRLQQMKGELVDRAKAVAQVFKLARDERDAWVNWPARVAARVLQEGMFALEDVVVGATDTDPARTNQGVPGIGPRGGSLLQLQVAWSQADKGVYELHGTRCRSQEWGRSRRGEEGRRSAGPSGRLLEVRHVVLRDQGGTRVNQRLDLTLMAIMTIDRTFNEKF